MARICPVHPAYGFSSHAGYATKQHRDAITVHGGVVRIHRFTFSPLKDRIEFQSLMRSNEIV